MLFDPWISRDRKLLLVPLDSSDDYDELMQFFQVFKLQGGLSGSYAPASRDILLAPRKANRDEFERIAWEYCNG